MKQKYETVNTGSYFRFSYISHHIPPRLQIAYGCNSGSSLSKAEQLGSSSVPFGSRNLQTVQCSV